MSDFYTDLADTAEDMIEEFGREVTLRRVNPGAYSPATNSNSGGSVVDRTISAVFTNYSEREIDGEIILRGDQKALVAATVEPAHNDKIIDGTKVFTVINVQPLQPGIDVLIYKLQVRR